MKRIGRIMMIIKEMVTSRGRLRGTISVPAEAERNTKNAAALDGY